MFSALVNNILTINHESIIIEKEIINAYILSKGELKISPSLELLDQEKTIKLI